MKRPQKQLPIDWNAKQTTHASEDKTDDSSGDVAMNLVNDFFFLQECLKEDEIAQELMVKQLYELVDGWGKYYLSPNRRVEKEALS